MRLATVGRLTSASLSGTRARTLFGVFMLTAAVMLSSNVSAQMVDVPIYRIRAGDTLHIEVAGQPNWTLGVNVRPDGRITYPATGEIVVAGLTLQELSDQIAYALGPGGRHLRNPNVFINVTGMRTPVAYLLGAVAGAGAIELPTGVSTAAKLLTVAGGPIPGADLRRVTLYRDDGTEQAIDLSTELGGGEQTIVRAGDVLVVPEIDVRYIGVLGAVGRAGEIELLPHQDSIDMLELLVKIGGFGEAADRERAMILRADGSIDGFLVDQVLAREIEPPLVYGGDVLWVPPLPPEPEMQYFAVTGAVKSAGQFEYRTGITLADALALSGQPGEAADPETVTIIHADGEKSIVDIRPMMRGEDTDTARMLIQPDDIVLVPARDKSYVMLGAIGQSGFFPWEEDIRLADALVRSGGFGRDAAAQELMLVRRSPEGGAPTVVQVDARGLIQGENEAANWALLPGDTIYVPERQRRGGIREALSEPLAILGVLGALERVFSW